MYLQWNPENSEVGNRFLNSSNDFKKVTFVCSVNADKIY